MTNMAGRLRMAVTCGKVLISIPCIWRLETRFVVTCCHPMFGIFTRTLPVVSMSELKAVAPGAQPTIHGANHG